MLLQMALFHSFLWPSSIPLYIYHMFFIQSSVDGHLGCFHVLAIVITDIENKLMVTKGEGVGRDQLGG